MSERVETPKQKALTRCQTLNRPMLPSISTSRHSAALVAGRLSCSRRLRRQEATADATKHIAAGWRSPAERHRWWPPPQPLPPPHRAAVTDIGRQIRARCSRQRRWRRRTPTFAPPGRAAIHQPCSTGQRIVDARGPDSVSSSASPASRLSATPARLDSRHAEPLEQQDRERHPATASSAAWW